MSLFLNNGLSGLLAAQTGLRTTSNNVANASTEGYVRQTVNFAERPGQPFGRVHIGNGVAVSGIKRVYDQLLANQLQSANTSQQRAEMFNSLAAKLDGILGNPDLGISRSIQSFFDSIEAVNRDPTSSVNRQQMIFEGKALVERFQQTGGRLDNLENEINRQLQQAASEVNGLSDALARLNARIAESGTETPNEMLDEQDRLLNRIAQQIDITRVRQDDGTVNVMVGNGQPIVLGGNSFKLGVLPDQYDGTRMQLAYQTTSQIIDISRKVSGGAIGGLLSFRDGALDGAKRDLGQLALGLSASFNTQHQQGLDLNGDMGAAFFSSVTPQVLDSSFNSGSAVVSASIADPAAVEAREYVLHYDGTAWLLTGGNGGAAVAMTGSGTNGDPFVADGLSITVSGAAASGDRYLIRPVSQAASDLEMAISDPSRIAAAAPLSASASLQNLSTTSISAVTVTDASAPNLLQPVDIVFDDPATYRILDANGVDLTGPLAYASGSDISFNGWTVQITGTPNTGERFSVTSAGPGSGDNSNSQLLGRVQTLGFSAGGTLSIEELGANLVNSVGSTALRAQQELSVQNDLQAQATLDVESMSGVNLEEEAVNMLRYQEAFLAASKIIGVANTLFQTLLGTLGR